MWEWIGFAVLGLAAGSISGVLGIGAAVFIIPALVFLFGFDQKTAQGTTLAMMIPPIGLLAAMEYFKSGHIHIVAAVLMAVFFFAGGWIGGRFAESFDPLILRRVFAVALVLIAIRMWI